MQLVFYFGALYQTRNGYQNVMPSSLVISIPRQNHVISSSWRTRKRAVLCDKNVKLEAYENKLSIETQNNK